MSSSKYYDSGKMHNIKTHHKNKWLPLFHVNACSFNKTFDDLQHLFSCVRKIDIIAISETIFSKLVSLLNDLNLNNFSFEFTLNEISAGSSILLYIDNHLSYKCRNDLNIYNKNELGSTFIEIVNPKKSNITVGVIYRHTSMDLTGFNTESGEYLTAKIDTNLIWQGNVMLMIFPLN